MTTPTDRSHRSERFPAFLPGRILLLTLALLVAAGLGTACIGTEGTAASDASGDNGAAQESGAPATEGADDNVGEGRPAAEPPPEGLAVATFAGGCFWCMEKPFDVVQGVVSTTSGFAGGERRRPTYGEVSSGATRHLEAVRVVYDPEEVSYQRLLEIFWHNIDPTDDGGQFCDRGYQYTTAVFVHDEEQRRAAEASKEAVAEQLSDEVVTEVVEAGPFYPAEEYHQDFYEKNPLRYTTYRKGCGRDARLEDLWGEQAGH